MKGEPVAIGRLERFVADWHRENGVHQCTEKPESNGIKVAVVGSGPCRPDLRGRAGQEGL